MVSSAQACISCGAINHKLHFEAFGYAIMECGNCGLAFTDTKVQAEASARFYKGEYYARASAYAQSLKQKTGMMDRDHQERIRTISRLVRRKEGHILDVGCASGSLLSAFRRCGWYCLGIEPSAEMAALARISAGCDVLESTLETSCLPPENYDAVTVLHVLEHSPDPRRFLVCCRRLLKREGVLLVEVPDFGSRRARAQGSSWLPLYPDTHFYHFTAKSLAALLERCGFQVARVRRYGGSPSADNCDQGSRQAGRISRLDRYFYDKRRLLLRLPFLMQLLRDVYWQILRMNESLRVYAVRTV